MANYNGICPNCGKEIPNDVLYRCIGCFTIYCSACDEESPGKGCPKCGMVNRMVLDQGDSKK